MRALLLAAGLGTRLLPLTKKIPKCLVPIHGVPLLEIWLAQIFYAGITRVVINLHHLPTPVRDLVKKSQWSDQIDLFDEPTLLGTGGTLRATRELLGEGPILVAHADNLSSIDLRAFHSAHLSRPKSCVMTMALFDTDTPQTCGIVELDQQNCVISMYEKPAHPSGTLANAAVYMVETEVLDQIEKIDAHQIDFSMEIIPLLMGCLYSYHIKGYHRDIGSLAALDQAHLDITNMQISSLMAPN